MDNIEHYSRVEIINQSTQDMLGFILLGVGLALTVAGFAMIRSAPWLGAMLVVGGIWTMAVMVFWFIVPLFVAAGVSAFAVMLARRRQSPR